MNNLKNIDLIWDDAFLLVLILSSFPAETHYSWILSLLFFFHNSSCRIRSLFPSCRFLVDICSQKKQHDVLCNNNNQACFFKRYRASLISSARRANFWSWLLLCIFANFKFFLLSTLPWACVLLCVLLRSIKKKNGLYTPVVVSGWWE